MPRYMPSYCSATIAASSARASAGRRRPLGRVECGQLHQLAHRLAHEGFELLGVGVGDRERERVDVDADLALDDEREEGLLARRVGVEEAGGDARGGGDVLHPGPPVAGGREDTQRGVEDLAQAAGRTGTGHDESINE